MDELSETDFIELARGPRKVRTPEGARQYGLPIGSIITADVIAAKRAEISAGKEKARAGVRPQQGAAPQRPGVPGAPAAPGAVAAPQQPKKPAPGAPGAPRPGATKPGAKNRLLPEDAQKPAGPTLPNPNALNAEDDGPVEDPDEIEINIIPSTIKGTQRFKVGESSYTAPNGSKLIKPKGVEGLVYVATPDSQVHAFNESGEVEIPPLLSGILAKKFKGDLKSDKLYEATEFDAAVEPKTRAPGATMVDESGKVQFQKQADGTWKHKKLGISVEEEDLQQYLDDGELRDGDEGEDGDDAEVPDAEPDAPEEPVADAPEKPGAKKTPVMPDEFADLDREQFNKVLDDMPPGATMRFEAGERKGILTKLPAGQWFNEETGIDVTAPELYGVKRFLKSTRPGADEEQAARKERRAAAAKGKPAPKTPAGSKPAPKSPSAPTPAPAPKSGAKAAPKSKASKDLDAFTNYTVTNPDGTVVSQPSKRTFTHSVAYKKKGDEGWSNLYYDSEEKAAERETELMDMYDDVETQVIPVGGGKPKDAVSEPDPQTEPDPQPNPTPPEPAPAPKSTPKKDAAPKDSGEKVTLREGGAEMSREDARKILEGMENSPGYQVKYGFPKDTDLRNDPAEQKKITDAALAKYPELKPKPAIVKHLRDLLGESGGENDADDTDRGPDIQIGSKTPKTTIQGVSGGSFKRKDLEEAVEILEAFQGKAFKAELNKKGNALGKLNPNDIVGFDKDKTVTKQRFIDLLKKKIQDTGDATETPSAPEAPAERKEPAAPRAPRTPRGTPPAAPKEPESPKEPKEPEAPSAPERPKTPSDSKEDAGELSMTQRSMLRIIDTRPTAGSLDDESPVRRELRRRGLIEHDGTTYRITDKGKERLKQIDEGILSPPAKTPDAPKTPAAPEPEKPEAADPEVEPKSSAENPTGLKLGDTVTDDWVDSASVGDTITVEGKTVLTKRAPNEWRGATNAKFNDELVMEIIKGAEDGRYKVGDPAEPEEAPETPNPDSTIDFDNAPDTPKGMKPRVGDYVTGRSAVDLPSGATIKVRERGDSVETWTKTNGDWNSASGTFLTGDAISKRMDAGLFTGVVYSIPEGSAPKASATPEPKATDAPSVDMPSVGDEISGVDVLNALPAGTQLEYTRKDSKKTSYRVMGDDGNKYLSTNKGTVVEIDSVPRMKFTVKSLPTGAEDPEVEAPEVEEPVAPEAPQAPVAPPVRDVPTSAPNAGIRPNGDPEPGKEFDPFKIQNLPIGSHFEIYPIEDPTGKVKGLTVTKVGNDAYVVDRQGFTSPQMSYAQVAVEFIQSGHYSWKARVTSYDSDFKVPDEGAEVDPKDRILLPVGSVLTETSSGSPGVRWTRTSHNTWQALPSNNDSATLRALSGTRNLTAQYGMAGRTDVTTVYSGVDTLQQGERGDAVYTAEHLDVLPEGSLISGRVGGYRTQSTQDYIWAANQFIKVGPDAYIGHVRQARTTEVLTRDKVLDLLDGYGTVSKNDGTQLPVVGTPASGDLGDFEVGDKLYAPNEDAATVYVYDGTTWSRNKQADSAANGSDREVSQSEFRKKLKEGKLNTVPARKAGDVLTITEMNALRPSSTIQVRFPSGGMRDTLVTLARDPDLPSLWVNLNPPKTNKGAAMKHYSDAAIQVAASQGMVSLKTAPAAIRPSRKDTAARIRDAKTPKDVRDAFADRFPDIVVDEYKPNSSGDRAEQTRTYKEFISSTTEILENLPYLQGLGRVSAWNTPPSRFGVSSNAMAWVQMNLRSFSGVTFNYNMKYTMRETEWAVPASIKAGHFHGEAKGSHVSRTVAHEMGHVIDAYMGSNAGLIAKKVYDQETAKDYDKTRAQVGEYATKNASELWAEMWMEYYQGVDPSELSTKVVSSVLVAMREKLKDPTYEFPKFDDK